MHTTWLVAVALAAAAATGVAHAQSITSIAGSPSHGSAIAIQGSAFGTKAVAAPMIFDDFERGSEDATVSAAPGWSEIGNDSGFPPRYRAIAKHSGTYGMYASFAGSQYNCHVMIDGGTRFQSGFYIDAWVNYLQPTNNARSWKPWDMFYVQGSSPSVNWAGECPGTIRYVTYCINSTPGETWADRNQFLDASLDDFSGGMHHLQIWISPSTPYGALNSAFQVILDGRVVANRTNMRSSAVGDTGYWKELSLGYYMTHDQNNQAGCVSPVGDGAMYWDDIYIDNTRARVELGNAATYSACTVREIQIPTSWSATAVNISFNQGSFQPGETAYLFVVTADGTPSPGYQVTIGGTAPTGPGQPGKPTF